MENIYVQFDGMVYQQIVGIPMGTNCAPLIADLFLCCYERDFMSNLQKSKRFDLIDKFNDTSRYLDDIFTIDNPTFAEHIPDIYPRELQLNKANTSDKETFFLDLNIKVIGNDIHTSVYDKHDHPYLRRDASLSFKLLRHGTLNLHWPEIGPNFKGAIIMRNAVNSSARQFAVSFIRRRIV